MRSRKLARYAPQPLHAEASLLPAARDRGPCSQAARATAVGGLLAQYVDEWQQLA
jgi:hypothetical protein